MIHCIYTYVVISFAGDEEADIKVSCLVHMENLKICINCKFANQIWTVFTQRI
jgi:hypothetical protein